MKMAKVVVYFDRKTARKKWDRGENVFALHLKQVLRYAGIPFTWVETVEEISDSDILLLALEPDNPHATEYLINFVIRGGILISYGGLNTMAATFGYETNDFGPGYAKGVEVAGKESNPIRFLKAITWRGLPKREEPPTEEKGELRLGTPEGKSIGFVYQKFSYGKGEVHRWSVDVIGTMVGLQQGTRPVTQDGRPAADGSGNLDDRLLKAEDGFELDWVHDRRTTETGEKYFAFPYADIWREVFIAHLLETALENGKTLPLIDYWPDGVQQVAMISHDSDINVDESAEITLDVLKECGLQSTWCMMEPGYSASVYQRVEKEGHEIALHFNALEADNGFWSENEFSRQLTWLQQTTGKTNIVSNKNHYTRFEGWGELYDWCEKYGIQSDQTRGPSKKGNIGFIFGTCHPFLPIAWCDQQNRPYNVVEIPFLTQDVDLDRLADTSIVQPFLQHVKQVRGVAHFLFHQIHVYRQASVHEAVKLVVEEARKLGYEFWTGKQINDWVRKRLAIQIEEITSDGTVKVSNEVRHAVLLIPVTKGEKQKGDQHIQRFGVWCRKQVVGGKVMELGEK